MNDTYRGTAPDSEPETRAIDSLARRVKFEFAINYHSAAELLLYGVGYQVSTDSPDDVLFEALLGDDANPAVPGYDPDMSAELYTTNGDTDTTVGALRARRFTPEMSTCQTASAIDPDDQWLPEDCASGFNFPDDEELIQEEFAKNLPFALAVGESARDPDDPVSVVGRRPPISWWTRSRFRTARPSWSPRSRGGLLSNVRMHYRSTAAGALGRRPGVAGRRAVRRHQRPLLRRVAGHGHRRQSRVTRSRSGSVAASRGQGECQRALHLHGARRYRWRGADPRRRGRYRDQPGAGRRHRWKYADEMAAALTAAGYTSDVYDFDTQGRKAPHHLGVLSHYKAVVWETGDDVILRAPGQVPGTAAKAALDIELSVRDYLNEGGKLLVSGKYALFAQSANGAYFYNPNAPAETECTDPGDLVFFRCLTTSCSTGWGPTPISTVAAPPPRAAPIR